MSEPRVAVVVRTKDRPLFLRRALGSIAAQTLVDWQCVIVNDGGDPSAVDAAIEALDEAHRGKVRAIHHEQPRGRWVSANAGVLATTAPLLVLHDDDDTWHPDFLARAVAYLDRLPERVGVVSRIEIRWEELRDGTYETVSRETFQPDLPVPTLADTLLFNRFVPIGFVYRRALHAEFGLYDERLPVIGDWNFNLRVLAKHPLDYLDDAVPYAYWHQRVGDTGDAGNSVIAARGDHAKYDALIRDEELRRHVEEHGLGLVLYLTKFIDRRFVEVENGIRGELRQTSPLSSRLVPRLRRLLRR
ncbi:glycosyltransferase family 2 protein [Microbacterium paludicola]|uniref:glycosyltransferase family 2 protein n=1 Tax=Microbacterium paludicola TaxID=300019 RepID=UPI00142FFE7B|nr:glycosyltransferase family A protein [Microbacterium paludicola]MBF0817235.1 glycosyltransferase family 2 protein [Microbacterium paludicola]